MSSKQINRSGNSNLPGAWPMAKVVETLGARIAMSAIRGNPSPVAAAVLARIEGGM